MQFAQTTRGNSPYGQAAANLSSAIFGAGPQSKSEALRDKVTEFTARKLQNQVRGQDDYRNLLQGVNGDLNNVDGGSLAAAMGLSGINPNVLTSMSLDPRFGEMAQRRTTVAAGKSPSMGAQAADIAAVNALTASRNRSGYGGGDGMGKPVKLLPSNLSAILEGVSDFAGQAELEPNMWENTIAENPDLSTMLSTVVSQANRSSGGDAAAAQAAGQEFISQIINTGETTGRGAPFWGIPGTGDDPDPRGKPRYKVNPELMNSLSEVLLGRQGQAALPSGPKQGAGQQASSVNAQAELVEAREAIARGADQGAVSKRLMQMGINPGDL